MDRRSLVLVGVAALLGVLLAMWLFRPDTGAPPGPVDAAPVRTPPKPRPITTAPPPLAAPEPAASEVKAPTPLPELLPKPQEGEAVVYGTVVDASGQPFPHAQIHGCGDFTTADADGSFHLEVEAKDCQLRATGTPGSLPAEPTELSLKSGETRQVRLVLP